MRAKPDFTLENGIVKCTALSEIPFIKHGFTSREGGISEGCYSSCNLGLNTQDSKENVLKNYELSAEKIGFDAKRLVLTNQVHSDKISIVSEKDCGNRLFSKKDVLETDGLITNCKNVPIGVFTADCTPILLCDTEKKVIAAVHSGWKGTLFEIGKKAVLKMCDESSCNPKHILAAIGPSIKKCHFEVKDDVYSKFCEKFGTSFIESVTEKRQDSFFIDTDTINRDSLASVGILKENINLCPICTFCESDKFFSHRASGGKTGRQCAFITII